MIRRNTWILLVLLAALVGFAFYYTNRKAQQAAAVTPTAEVSASKPLFDVAEGQVTDLKVEDTTGNSVEVKRNAAGEWVLNAPTEAPADQGAAEAAATQVTSLQVISSVQLGLELVGLDKPAYTMTFTFSSKKTHKLEVGALTPIQDGYYTTLDGGPVRIVDKQGIDALVELLSKPPYAVTATPEVTSTTEPPAAPAQTETPTVGATAVGATPGTPVPTTTTTEASPTPPAPATPTP